MIRVTRLSGGQIVVNVDLIISVEETPDTLLSFVNGDRLAVRESPDEIVTLALAYRRRAVATADEAA
jgi:flagellar protein FlbD